MSGFKLTPCCCRQRMASPLDRIFALLHTLPPELEATEHTLAHAAARLSPTPNLNHVTHSTPCLWSHEKTIERATVSRVAKMLDLACLPTACYAQKPQFSACSLPRLRRFARLILLERFQMPGTGACRIALLTASQTYGRPAMLRLSRACHLDNLRL